MDLQHWSIINLERVTWKIYLVNNLSILLSFQISPILGIKNKRLEVIETSPNPSKLFPFIS